MIDFSIDDALGARVARFAGAVDDAELIGAYRRLLTSPRYDPTLNDLVDLRAVEKLNVTADGVRELVHAFTPLDDSSRPNRLAIVADADLAYGMARMYEILRSDAPEEVRVFRDIEPAREWLEEYAHLQARARRRQSD